MKRSKTKIILAVLSVAAAVAFAVKIATLWESPTPQAITIEVTGIQGRAVEARVDADGRERTLKGTIPTAFTVEAHRISWEVRRLDGPEEELFKVAVHIPSHKNWGGSAENYQHLRGGSVGPSGLRRSRAWHGRFYE